MIFYVIVIGNFFKNQAKNIFESIFSVWVHVAPNSFVTLIENPLETSIDFAAFVHRKRDRCHLKVNWKFVCLFLTVFRIFKEDKIIALSFNETNETFWESMIRKIVT